MTPSEDQLTLAIVVLGTRAAEADMAEVANSSTTAVRAVLKIRMSDNG